MRVMALDVGKRFSIRIDLYASVYLVVYTGVSAIYLCWFFEVLSSDFSLNVIVIGTFEIINFYYFIYIMICFGVKINEITTS